MEEIPRLKAEDSLPPIQKEWKTTFDWDELPTFENYAEQLEQLIDIEAAKIQNDTDLRDYLFAHHESMRNTGFSERNYNLIIEYLSFEWVTATKEELLERFFFKADSLKFGRDVIHLYLENNPEKDLTTVFWTPFGKTVLAEWTKMWQLYDARVSKRVRELKVSAIIAELFGRDELLHPDIVDPNLAASQTPLPVSGAGVLATGDIEDLERLAPYLIKAKVLNDNGIYRHNEEPGLTWATAGFMIRRISERLEIFAENSSDGAANVPWAQLCPRYGINHNSALCGSKNGGGNPKWQQKIDQAIDEYLARE